MQAQAQAATAEAATLQRQLAESQAQVQAATAEAAALQRQLEYERAAALGVQRQLGEERDTTRTAAARQCAAAEAAQQRAEAHAADAGAQLGTLKAQVHLAEQGSLVDTRLRRVPNDAVPMQLTSMLSCILPSIMSCYPLAYVPVTVGSKLDWAAWIVQRALSLCRCWQRKPPSCRHYRTS